MLYVRVQKARCLQLTTRGREKSRGSRPITPHLLLLFPWITGLEPSWPALYFTFSLLHFPKVFVPIPPKTTHVSSSSIGSQTLNRQPSSLSPPRLWVLNDKSLDYTVQQHPFISLPSIPPALALFSLHPPLSLISVYLAFMSFLLPVLHFVHTRSLCMSMHLQLNACVHMCTHVILCCLPFHTCLSALQSLSKLHRALAVWLEQQKDK